MTSWNDVIYYVLLVQCSKLIGQDWEKKRLEKLAHVSVMSIDELWNCRHQS